MHEWFEIESISNKIHLSNFLRNAKKKSCCNNMKKNKNKS